MFLNSTEGVVLPLEEQSLPWDWVAYKYGISRATAYRAKNGHKFYPGYHKPGRSTKMKLPPREKIHPSWMKKAVVLSDEERQLTLTQIQVQFDISSDAAFHARKRGWFIRKDGLACNFLPHGELPGGTSDEDLISSATDGAWAALRCCTNLTPGIKQFLPDLIQEGVKRLLEKTAEENISNPKWRFGLCKKTSLEYLKSKVWRHEDKEAISTWLQMIKGNIVWSGREKEESSMVEAMPAAESVSLFAENALLLNQICEAIGEENWKVLMNWAESNRRNPTKKAAELIEGIRISLGF